MTLSEEELAQLSTACSVMQAAVLRIRRVVGHKVHIDVRVKSGIILASSLGNNNNCTLSVVKSHCLVLYDSSSLLFAVLFLLRLRGFCNISYSLYNCLPQAREKPQNFVASCKVVTVCLPQTDLTVEQRAKFY